LLGWSNIPASGRINNKLPSTIAYKHKVEYSWFSHPPRTLEVFHELSGDNPEHGQVPLAFRGNIGRSYG